MEILSKKLNKRLKSIVICATISFFTIILYLFHLQINLMEKFFQRSQKNFIRYEKINSPRGSIIDCNGNLIATNRPVDIIYWKSTNSKKLTSYQESTINELKEILNLTEEQIEKIILAQKQGDKVVIAEDVNFEQLSKIIEKFPNNKNILIDRQFKRYYPQKNIASHIVGYLALDIETTGKMGLELICNNNLKGQSGEIIKTINSIGHSIGSEVAKKASTGETIQTTLNLKLQMIAEKLFPQNFAGTFILIDPKTGGLEVLLSNPNFDPNIFLEQIKSDEWQELQKKKCFINRAFNACYPPASIFKLVTLSAALENNIIDENSSWVCTGQLSFAGRFYHCMNRQGHGLMNTKQALAYSCNIPFFSIGKKIKIDTLADYANKLGLGKKTSIIFEEKTGLIPSSLWKLKTKGEQWWPGETLSAVIGQSFMLVTPIQIACMISGICKGYLVQPRILTNEPIIKKPININKKTLKFLKTTMRSVIEEGSARRLSNMKDFKIHGKTGTAQTINNKESGLTKEQEAHAWFTAYFRYKNHPAKTLVILIENAGYSGVATEVAQRFFKEYRKIIDQENQNTI